MRPDLDAMAARYANLWTIDDEEFIEAARSDVPVLLDYIRELEAVNTELVDGIKAVGLSGSQSDVRRFSARRTGRGEFAMDAELRARIAWCILGFWAVVAVAAYIAGLILATWPTLAMTGMVLVAVGLVETVPWAIVTLEERRAVRGR